MDTLMKVSKKTLVSVSTILSPIALSIIVYSILGAIGLGIYELAI